MKHTRAGSEDHDREDQHQHHRGAEVGLDHDERREPASYHTARNKRAPEVSFFTRALLEEVREKNNEREFCDLARLQRDARKLYPTVRAIRAAKSKHRNEADRAHQQKAVDEATVL